MWQLGHSYTELIEKIPQCIYDFTCATSRHRIQRKSLTGTEREHSYEREEKEELFVFQVLSREEEWLEQRLWLKSSI